MISIDIKTKECITCKETFEKQANISVNNWGKRQFCSRDCKHKYGRVEIVCVSCTKLFTVKKSQKDSLKTCSKKCHSLDLSKRMTGRKITWGDKIGKTNAIVLKGMKQSEESKDNKIKTMKKLFKSGNHNWAGNPPSLGKKMLDETKEKIRQGQLKLVKSGKHPFYKGGIWNKERKVFIERRRQLRKTENGGDHTQEEWYNLKRKYDFMCLCCKKQEPEIKLTEDHVIPISKGGRDDIENIQPLCRKCNSIKATKIMDYQITLN